MGKETLPRELALFPLATGVDTLSSLFPFRPSHLKGRTHFLWKAHSDLSNLEPTPVSNM